MKTRPSCRASVSVVVFLALVSWAAAAPQTTEERAPSRALARMAIPGTSDLQLVIRLESPSVVEWMRAGGGMRQAQTLGAGRRLNLQSAQAVTHRSRLAREQASVVRALTNIPGVSIEGSTDVVMNALIARVPLEKYSEVRKLPGVRKVYFSRPYRKLLDAAAGLVNASALWTAAGGRANAGKGVKIGIIDSGIDITNPMFIDSSLSAPSGYPKGESAFTNSKVIVARNYVHLLARTQSVQTAIDEGGHGSFVAGVAAGKQVTAPNATISGMAPGAYLGSYKIFGTPGINDSATTSAIVAAIDGAVADGMDVLNLSFGSLDYLPPSENAEYDTVRNAIAAGVVVVAAAGNEGPETHTVSSPGTIPEVVTVGSVSNSRKLAAPLHVTAPAPVPSDLAILPYASSDGPQVTTSIPATRLVNVAALDGNGYGCSAFASGSLASSIALVQRGGVESACTFVTKVSNASAAGAVAVVVYNNVASGGTITMSGLGSTSIPAVMITTASGLALRDFVAANPGAVRVSIESVSSISAVPTQARIISDFSAVGPGTDFSLKPDLVAVGVDIYSAAQANNPNGELYSLQRFTSAQGTSFSSPMVAGAAAAVKGLFPSLGPQAIKSILTSTASQGLTVDGSNAADILQTGSGLLDMGAAASAQAWFSASALNFGVQQYQDTLSLTRTFAITNISSRTDQFTVTVAPLIDGAAATLSRTETGPVAPGASATVDLTLQVTAPASRGFQGFVLVRSAATSTVYRIPYWAGLYVRDASRILTTGQGAGNAFSTLAAAVRSARPGNVIEISDSRTYPTELLVRTNDEGLPLDGITIRAAQGQTPVLDGSSSSDAVVRILGSRDVLLQGLTIRGAPVGVLISQPSTGVPTSVTVDQCTVSESTDSTSAAIFAESGGGVYITKSTVQNSAGTGIKVDGAYLTVLGSTVQQNGGGGISTTYSNVQILNSNVTENSGPGLFVDTCSGTIDGNTFARNRGIYGDGFEISDSTFTISNNLFDGNERAAMGFFDGNFTAPSIETRVSGNTVRGNVYGVLANPGRGIVFDGNLVEDNGRGMRFTGSSSALLTNNIVVRSTDASLGDGIQAAGSSAVRIVNNTVYGNRGLGVNVSAAATADVQNSIVASNSGGDLQGLSQANVQYSLIGTGTFAGSNGNATGDPKFVGPDADNFTPGAGSPALDAGSNAVADLPFLDFGGHLRVATASALPGDGRVDMGASEAGSAFPLIFPLVANGTQTALGDSVTTGFAATNDSDAAVAAEFVAYDPAGALLPGSTNPSTRSLAAGAQVPILGFQLFGFNASTTLSGGALASAPWPLAGFFLLFDTDFSRFADGTIATDQTGEDLYLVRHLFDATGKATYAVFNPGVNTANVKASLVSSQGSTLDLPRTAAVPPKGQFVFSFENLTASSGYIHLESDRPVSAIEMFGKSPVVSVLNAVAPGSEARLFFPHVAVNGGFTSLIGLVNSSGSAAAVTLAAYDNTGRMLGAPVQAELAAGAQLLESVGSLFGIRPGPLVAPYIVVESNVPGVEGFTQFVYDDGGNRSAAVVPADSVPRQHLVFSHIAHQVPAGSGESYLTGIGLLNPFRTTVKYTLSVYDGAGVKVAETRQTLGPGEKVAKMLSHPVTGAGFFTQTLPLASGHVEVDTDYGLLGFELFFTETFSQLASVPPQN